MRTNTKDHLLDFTVDNPTTEQQTIAVGGGNTTVMPLSYDFTIGQVFPSGLNNPMGIEFLDNKYAVIDAVPSTVVRFYDYNHNFLGEKDFIGQTPTNLLFGMTYADTLTQLPSEQFTWLQSYTNDHVTKIGTDTWAVVPNLSTSILGINEFRIYTIQQISPTEHTFVETVHSGLSFDPYGIYAFDNKYYFIDRYANNLIVTDLAINVLQTVYLGLGSDGSSPKIQGNNEYILIGILGNPNQEYSLAFVNLANLSVTYPYPNTQINEFSNFFFYPQRNVWAVHDNSLNEWIFRTVNEEIIRTSALSPTYNPTHIHLPLTDNRIMTYGQGLFHDLVFPTINIISPESQAQITRLTNNLASCPHTINELRIVGTSFEELRDTKVRIVRYDAFGKTDSSEIISLAQYLNPDLKQPIVSISQLNGLEIDQNTGIELIVPPNSSISFLLDLEPHCVPKEVINLIEKPKEMEKKKRTRKRIIKRIRKCVCTKKIQTARTEIKMESSAIKVPKKDTSDAALILRLDRFIGTDKESLGKLYVKGFLQDNFECFIMEDEYRKDKIMAETRISQGTYEIKLANWGRHHAQYGARYPNDHVGMLILQDVPNFQGILIHQGTTEMDTAGCLLTGDDYEYDEARDRYKLIDSGKAYIRLYRKVAPLLAQGERVFIKITDFDFGFKSSIYWLHRIRYMLPFFVLLGVGAFFAWKNRELIGKELGKMGVKIN